MTFLVVGSGSDIGKSVIKELKNLDLNVITMSHREETCDLSDTHYFVSFLDKNVDLPKIDKPLKGLIYLPGSMNLKPFENLKLEQFSEDLHLNFLGFVHILHHYLPNLKQSDNASIVSISSVAASIGLAYHTSISASKGALEGFSLALAAELAPKIRVNVVAPSLCDTHLAKPILDRPAQKEISIKRHPLHQIGSPEDIAKMARFLLTDDSKWITGQVFHVDGGLSTIHLF